MYNNWYTDIIINAYKIKVLLINSIIYNNKILWKIN